MKTLYVTDLDGTLLRSDERTSDFTNQTIHDLVNQGMIFSYATARSYHTSHKVTNGLVAKIPLIIYNGALIIDNQTQEILLSNFFYKEDIHELLHDFISHHIYPTVYSFIDGVEKFSYIEEKLTSGMKEFVESRKEDQRIRIVERSDSLFDGEIFYFTCIDEEEKLKPFYQKYKEQYHCVFQKDIYTQEQWLEIMPKNTSKAHAILQLKDYLKCDKVVVFGDGLNDVDMFEIADESYAVENAAEELKNLATDIIGHHNDDAVAKWLLEHYISDFTK